MMVVIIAITIASVLAVTFLASQEPSTAIAGNIDRHAGARGIAESGLTTAIEYVRRTDGWRDAQTSGVWLPEQDFGGGEFRLMFEAADGDLAGDSDEPVTVTAEGTFEGAVHRVSAVITPGEEEVEPTGLVFVAGHSSPSTSDQRKIDLFESWGWTVTVIDDSAPQADYDAATAGAAVAYISEECGSGSVAGKLDDAEIGIVNEETYLHDSFGFTSGNGGKANETRIDVVNNTHYITSELSLGTVTVADSSTAIGPHSGGLGDGVEVLAEQYGGSTSAVLAVLDTGALRRDDTPSPGRRVSLCFTNDDVNTDILTDDGLTILRRSLEWASQGAALDDDGPAQLVALYEFNEVPIVPDLKGHWQLDETNSSGGGLASNSEVYLRNNAIVDSYDAGAGPYGGGNVGAQAVIGTNHTGSRKIKLDNNAELHGDAYVGVGGNPGSGIQTANNAEITGVQAALDEAMPIETDIAWPIGMPANEGDKKVSGSQTFDSDRHFDKLELKNNARLTISGHVRILCRDEFEVSNNAEIILDPGASLRVYVDEEVVFKNGSKINNDSMRPGDFRLYILSDEKLTIDNNAEVAGRIATEGEVELGNNAVVYGSISADGDVKLSNNAKLHQDMSLPSVTGMKPPMEDAAGNNNGAYTVGGTLGEPGAIAATGSSVRFDGADDYAVIPHNDDYLLDAGSLSLWFKTADKEKDQSIFSKDSTNLDTGGHLTVLIDGGYVKTRLQSTSETWQFTAAAPVQENAWHHLVFTWGPNKMRLYVDGVEIGDPYDYIGGTGDTSGDIGNYEPIVLGADARHSDDLSPTPVRDFFDGWIDDVRIYDQALDQSQVDNVYAGDDPGPSSFPGYIVEDTSGFGDPLNMTVQDTDAIAWVDGGGLTLTSATSVISDTVATKITSALRATDQMSVEAIVTPANTTQDGPARIVSLSADPSHRNFTVGQDDDEVHFRLRTSDTGDNGTPAAETDDGLDAGTQTSIIVTADGEEMKVYIDGVLAATEPRTGDLDDWDSSYRLLLGAEMTGDSPWLGTLHRVAIYDRALTVGQVENVADGLPPGDATGSTGGFDVVWTEY